MFRCLKRTAAMSLTLVMCVMLLSVPGFAAGNVPGLNLDVAAAPAPVVDDEDVLVVDVPVSESGLDADAAVQGIKGFVYNSPSDSGTPAYLEIDVEASGLERDDVVEVYSDPECTKLIGSMPVGHVYANRIFVMFNKSSLRPGWGNVYVKVAGDESEPTEIPYIESPWLNIDGERIIGIGGTTALTVSKPDAYEIESVVITCDEDSPIISLDGNVITGKAEGRDEVTFVVSLVHPQASEGATGTIRIKRTITVRVEERLYEMFADVHKGNPYYDGLKFAYDRGLMSGTSSTTLYPGGMLTRGQFVTMLWRLAGSPDAASSSFSDVGDTWYTTAVDWAVENGIASGCGDGLFRPDQMMLREQMATMLYRYCERYDLGLGKYDGVPVEYVDMANTSEWAEEAMQWLHGNDMIFDSWANGGDWGPNFWVTREHAAYTLMLFVNQYGL